MTDQTLQCQNSFFDKTPDIDPDLCPFGPEAEQRRIELEREGESLETLVSRIRRAIREEGRDDE